MLATFTGLLVIRNVSRLLHTPLMSLTNAISAIAVVGSIMLAGERQTTVHRDSRRRGRVRLDDEHRQRLYPHRSDAQDVQEAGAWQVMNMDTVIQPIYLVSAMLFILSLMWMNHPSTARRGVFAGVVAMVAAIGGTLLLPEIHYWHWIAIGMVSGTVLGVPLALVPLTAVPQRTALSHAFGGLAAGLVGAAEYYLATTGYHQPLTQIRHRRHRGRSHLGLSYLYRQLDGGRQTPGNDPHPAHHL